MKRVSWLVALAGALVGAAALADDTPAHTCPHAVSANVMHPGRADPPSAALRWWVPEPDGVVAMVGSPRLPWPPPPPGGVWRVVASADAGAWSAVQAEFPGTDLVAASGPRSDEAAPRYRDLGYADVQLDDVQAPVASANPTRVVGEHGLPSVGWGSGPVLWVLVRASGNDVGVVAAVHPEWLARQPSARSIVLDFTCVGGWRIEVGLPASPAAGRGGGVAGDASDGCRSYPVDREGAGVLLGLGPPSDGDWAAVRGTDDGARVLWNQYVDRAFTTCAARRPQGVCVDGYALRLSEALLYPSFEDLFRRVREPNRPPSGRIDLACGYVCASCPSDEARYRMVVRGPDVLPHDELATELRYDARTWERLP